MDIRVLWIDDQPNDDFMEMAEKYGLYVDNRMNVDSGIDELINSSNSYDAIILDANCISHNDGTTVTDISALGYALRKISENKITLPWFVYSGGGFSGEGSIDIMVRAYERPYDDKNWYRKPLEIKVLFAKIKEVVPKSDVYNIKQKYSNIFSWYPNTADLVKIVNFLEYNFNNDPSVFNLIRKELDWVMGHLYECGLLLEPYKGSNLSDCSTFLGSKELQDLVPIHIQRSLHSVTVVCNEGSHRLTIDEMVKDGKAPYLVKTTILELLNILFWLKDVKKETENGESLREIVKERFCNEPNSKCSDYEGKTFVVEKDGNNYHCGECELYGKIAQHYLGKYVKLRDVEVSKSTNKYPYYAKFEVVELK